jgi:acyl-CoA thioesterase FadM
VHYRDRLRINVLCEEIRVHAFRVRYELAVVPDEGKGEPKPSSRIVLVHAVTSLTHFSLQPVPGDLRATLETVLESAAPS